MGRALATGGGALRRDQAADQRPRLLRQPVPGGPGRLGATTPAVDRVHAVANYPEADMLDRHGTDGPFDGSARLGALANTGYQQARFNVGSMAGAGLNPDRLDRRGAGDGLRVERRPGRERGRGPRRGPRIHRRRLSDRRLLHTPYLWAQIVDDLALGCRKWRAAGETSRAEAARRCADGWTIQGGEAVLAQWLEDRRDRNITCPGVHRDLTRWFHPS